MSGLYSPINRLMEQVTRPKGTGAEYMAELQKKPGYKPAEAEDRDLQTLMALPQMERAAFMEKLKAQANKYPLKQRVLEGAQTHHETYTLPGGENYREILLHTPGTKDEELKKKLNDIDDLMNSPTTTTEQYKKLYATRVALADQYTHGVEGSFPGVPQHFGGTPNILASVRVKDRTSPEGKKILHIEEIQSDWHQQGREHGYHPKDLYAQIRAATAEKRMMDRYLKEADEDFDDMAYGEYGRMVDDHQAATEKLDKLRQLKEEGAPYGPHAKDWHELALKAMIQHAAENGYDQIAVTPGAEQAKRYGLSKQVGSVSYNPESRHFQAFKPNRETITSEKGATPERIQALIGKEAAAKLLQAPKTMGHHYLEGEGLDIGGEGMKGFYDKMVPTFLNKFGKKHGVQVQRGSIETKPAREEPQLAAPGIGHFPPPIKHPAELAPVHTFDITPQMREDVLKNGIPRYAEGGEVDDDSDVPRETVKAYKLFRVHPKHPGKLFPLFVNANTPVEMGKWIAAQEGEMANGKVKSKIGPLAYRPGWHAGDLPVATHIGEKSDPALTAPDLRPENHAWAEVEMPHDVDWQSVANERGVNKQGRLIPSRAHITDQIPVGGHYRYKTNPNMTGNWLIGGSMKVNRILSDKEVAKINKAAGAADLPRARAFNPKKFGFAEGGTVGPEEWMAEEHVNHKVLPRKERDANLAKMLESSVVKDRMYHGTNKNVKSFDPAKSHRPLSWFTDSPEHANKFVAGGRRNMGAKPTKGSAVYPVHLALKNPLDLTKYPPGTLVSMREILAHAGLPNDEKALKEIANAALDSKYAGVSSGIADPIGHLAKDYASEARINDMIDNPALLSVLKKGGFDSLKSVEDGTNIYATFHPHQIKSAIGNRGTYDTRNPDITKATGGSIKDKVTMRPSMDVMRYELINRKAK